MCSFPFFCSFLTTPRVKFKKWTLLSQRSFANLCCCCGVLWLVRCIWLQGQHGQEITARSGSDSSMYLSAAALSAARRRSQLGQVIGSSISHPRLTAVSPIMHVQVKIQDSPRARLPKVCYGRFGGPGPILDAWSWLLGRLSTSCLFYRKSLLDLRALYRILFFSPLAI